MKRRNQFIRLAVSACAALLVATPAWLGSSRDQSVAPALAAAQTAPTEVSIIPASIDVIVTRETTVTKAVGQDNFVPTKRES